MKELWLFTMHYPFGVREAFLENEIPVLCKRFDRVLVFPENRSGAQRTMPPNAELRFLLDEPYSSATFPQLMRSMPSVLRLVRSLWRDTPSLAVLRKQWPTLRSSIAQFVRRADALQTDHMPRYDPDHVVAYAYWTHNWATVLGLVQDRSPQLRFISRAHGFDVFDRENENGWIPFRSYQLDHVSKIYCASESSQAYLKQRYPRKAGIIERARLGSRDHGPGPYDPSGPLKVVSCSFLIPLKRVLRLVEALALVGQPVQWTHFGGGEEEEQVRTAASRLPGHIKVDLRGMTPNDQIIAWYRTHPVDVFVHVSRSEGGVPMALQEAASFGIPLVAADAGGVREIVGSRTGILLGPDPSPGEIAEALEEFRSGPMASAEFRDGVRTVWKEGFEANTVYERFVDRWIQH